MNKALATLKEPTTIESIIAHLQSGGEIELPTAAAQEKLMRISAIDELYRLYKVPAKVYEMHMYRFDVSLSTAKRDLREMKRVYGTITSFEKEYERTVAMEWVKEIAHKAASEGKYMAFFKGMELFRRFGPFDEDEVELPQHNLEAHTLVLTYNLETLNLSKMPNIEAAKKRIRQKRVLKMQGIEDIEGEDVLDEN
jgi:hypothetical protein